MRDVSALFPELADIADPDVRSSVRECWATACAENEVDSLSSVPWLPPLQREYEIEGETLVSHTRDVVAAARSLADSLARTRNAAIEPDLLLGGALVHDVSKLYEFRGMEETDAYELLGHPYVGVHCVLRAGLPVEYAHIVLSHTSRTPVKPAFLEATLIACADEAAARSIKLEHDAV